MKSALFLLALSGLAAAQQIPRPEHPQPQFERETWMNLNGKWDFDFDDRNVGSTQSWASGSHRFSRNITVPFCFESRNSGVAETGFHPWAWYRREFAIPAAWNGKRVLLHFGAVDYRAMVWVNGRLVGRHEGGNVPFTFDIMDHLKTDGTNAVVVRAEDPPTDRYIPRGKQYWEPKSRSIFYTRTSAASGRPCGWNRSPVAISRACASRPTWTELRPSTRTSREAAAGPDAAHHAELRRAPPLPPRPPAPRSLACSYHGISERSKTLVARIAEPVRRHFRTASRQSGCSTGCTPTSAFAP